jgi:hypothetical protein
MDGLEQELRERAGIQCRSRAPAGVYETPNMQQMVLAGIQFILGDLEADVTLSAKLAAKK